MESIDATGTESEDWWDEDHFKLPSNEVCIQEGHGNSLLYCNGTECDIYININYVDQIGWKVQENVCCIRFLKSIQLSKENI